MHAQCNNKLTNILEQQLNGVTMYIYITTAAIPATNTASTGTTTPTTENGVGSTTVVGGITDGVGDTVAVT